jgi:hypothetical protein
VLKFVVLVIIGCNSVRIFFLVKTTRVRLHCILLSYQGVISHVEFVLLCIKLVIIKKLYYDARPTKYQDPKYLFIHS